MTDSRLKTQARRLAILGLATQHPSPSGVPGVTRRSPSGCRSQGPQVFAAGPLLKNTFTLTRDRYAFVSQHIGDLENLETLEHYEAALATYQHLFRIEPELVVCDLHPDYMSTRFAESFAQEHGLPAPLRVQHHQAHIAACLADNGWSADDGPVIGVALDGTGYGEDGQIWGGEWFVGDYSGFERVAHLEYLPLPGGDAAIRHPVAHRGRLSPRPAGRRDALGRVLPRRCDARADNGRSTAQHAADLVDGPAVRCGQRAAGRLPRGHATKHKPPSSWSSSPPGRGHLHGIGCAALPVSTWTRDAVPYQIGVGSLFDAILADMERGNPRPRSAGASTPRSRQMIVTVCERCAHDREINTVALSGGVFQNRLLTTQAPVRAVRGRF